MHVSGSKTRVSTGLRTCCNVVPKPKLHSFKPVSHVQISAIPPFYITLFIAEPSVDGATPYLRKCTYAELYELVAALVSAFHKHGVKAGDRVASYSSNCIVSIPHSFSLPHISPPGGAPVN
jgi:acyl-CoA synthetase (AMP-forming)/AMP-acid ligase II